MTGKVYMTVSGRLAVVPADKADLVHKKQKLIQAVKILEQHGTPEYADLLLKLTKQIQRLSKKIGPCVRFL